MATWFFVSDLHGRIQRYRRLFRAIAEERPVAVLLGGDLLPGGAVRIGEAAAVGEFGEDFLRHDLFTLRRQLGPAYPRILFILGNDDPRCEEAPLAATAAAAGWEYIHAQRAAVSGYDVYGYACVPPTPFLLKDWERYDVSRSIDPGCVPPEEGHHTAPVSADVIQHSTIEADLVQLVGGQNLDCAIMLFHAPPYQTDLDRAALDGRTVEHVPLDVHVGSVAIRRFIEDRQPLLTLHGHIHESARLTGRWSQRIGRTYCFSAAHDGPELALVRFDPADLSLATRTLL